MYTTAFFSATTILFAFYLVYILYQIYRGTDDGAHISSKLKLESLNSLYRAAVVFFGRASLSLIGILAVYALYYFLSEREHSFLFGYLATVAIVYAVHGFITHHSKGGQRP